MRMFLTTLTGMSFLGAKYPDDMLRLTEAERWQGCCLMASITIIYFIIRPYIIKRINNV